jgi:SsrA-binding protein
MSAKTASKSPPPKIIADNRRARHDYNLEQQWEAGIALAGWEVKSIRAGRVQLGDSYAIIKDGEVWLLGAHINPLITASTHISPDAQRTRKLLLHDYELKKIIGAVQRKGYTLVPLNMHWHKNHIKIELALAKGKKQYDKRETTKRRDWERQKQRLRKIVQR